MPHDVAQIEAAEYIREMAIQLGALAEKRRLRTTHYLLNMVWAETHDIVRHAGHPIANLQCEKEKARVDNYTHSG
jgi:hypothetical protein